MQRNEHLLTIAAEECAETAQRISKALRFTLTEIEPGQMYSNSARIMHEYCDIIASFEMLIEAGLVVMPTHAKRRILTKKANVEKFLKLSAQLGTLE